MYYYLYQTRNTINDKIYIGVHQTENIDDGYLGSGTLLSRAIEKYGCGAFEKVILETFDSAEAMYAREAEVVNEAFLCREDVYNLKVGGNGGWDYANKQTDQSWRLDTASHMNKVLKRRIEAGDLDSSYFQTCQQKGAESFRRRLHDEPELAKKFKDHGSTIFLGKSHTKETKERMRTAAKLRVGHRNSMHGKCWITDGTSNKVQSKLLPIPDGWRKGRSISQCGDSP